MNKRNKKAKILLFVIFSDSDTINLSLIQKINRVSYYQIGNTRISLWQWAAFILILKDYKKSVYISFSFSKVLRYIYYIHSIKSLCYEFGWTPCIFFTIIVYLCFDESSKNSFSRCTWSLESCNLDKRYLYHEI